MGFEIESDVLQAYTEEAGVTEIVIPDSITVIDDYAFFECTGLKKVTIPDSVTTIGWSAFEGCTGLTTMTIPDSVTEIGDSAFEGCTSLTAVKIPNRVTVIGWGAFNNCTGLTTVRIPDGVRRIGYNAFYGCERLKTVTIPDSVTEIGKWAFKDCGCVIWKGVALIEDPEGKVTLEEMLSMVQEKNYTMKMNHVAKYLVLWMQFCKHPEDAELSAYIAEHFEEMFPYAIWKGIIEAVELVCKQGKWLTAGNIDQFLEYAIKQNQTNIQLLLMNYKNEHIGYSEHLFKL